MEDREYQGHIYRRGAPGEPWQLVGPAGTSTPSSQPRAPVFVPGAPKQVDPVEIERDRIGLQRDQIGLEAARLTLDEKRNPAPKPAKALPEGAAKRLEDTIGLYANLKGAAGGFQDEYAGNTLTGGLENTIQGLNSGFGTPGQRDWWANFRTLDNQIRNELFGATLTPSEQAAYAQTSINERMDPKTVRENLSRRERVIREALGRRTKYLKANGYNPEAIDALTGEFGADLSPVPSQDRPKAPPAPDEMLAFNDEERPITGYRLQPEQEGQIAEAIAVGDEGQALALYQRFSGNPPTSETIASVRAAIKNKGRITFNYGAVDRAAQEQADLDRFGNNLPAALEERKGAGVDAVVRGIADTGSFGLADEISAGATTLFSGGTMRENLQRERAIDEADKRVNAPARLMGQLGGAVINPLGRNATTVGEVTRAGGAGGALYGFGSGEDLANRGTSALAGGLAGATGGYVVGRASNALSGALARRAEVRAAQPNALLQAADRQGVDLMPADVGGPLVRRSTAAAAQAPLSASPVISAAQRTVSQSRAARDRIASQTGRVVDKEAAGDAVRAGGERFIATTKQQADRYYDRAEQLAQGAKVTPARTLEALDRNIAQLREDPSAIGGSHLNALEKLREAIGNGQLSVAGIRSMRSRLRQQFLDDGLRSSDFQRRVGEVVDSASEDLTSNLVEQGLETAASAFRRADQFYRGRVEAIDTLLDPIIGKGKSAEQVMQALEGAAKSNGRRLQGIITALPAEERSAVQATVISRLGVKNGDAEAADFSLDVFLSQWKAMSPRAKSSLFPGEARSALEDLVKVAEGSKAAGAYANRSNSAGGVLGNVGLYVGAGAWEPATAALVGLSQYAAGKLLASPKFARWLARAPKSSSSGAARSWVNRIPQIPAVRGEIEQVQQRLLSNLTASPSRVSASEGQQDRRPEPVN